MIFIEHDIRQIDNLFRCSCGQEFKNIEHAAKHTYHAHQAQMMVAMNANNNFVRERINSDADMERRSTLDRTKPID